MLRGLEDAPQDGIISSERVIESSGRSREVCDMYGRLSSKLLDDVANNVLGFVSTGGLYASSSSSSFQVGRLTDTERENNISSRDPDLAVIPDTASSIGWLLRGVDSGRRSGAAIGGDESLEKKFLDGAGASA